MSENVTSQGFFAVLKTPITDEEDRENKSEALYDYGLGIDLNYEGTLVYSDNRTDGYGLFFGVGNVSDVEKFKSDCKAADLEIDETTINPYICTWYNGSDSDMSLLTAKEYMEKIS